MPLKWGGRIVTTVVITAVVKPTHAIGKTFLNEAVVELVHRLQRGPLKIGLILENGRDMLNLFLEVLRL